MSPDDPRHGTIAGYTEHYRTKQKPCRACKDGKNAYLNKRHREKGYGRWDKMTDADPIRAHVQNLMDNGMGYRRIAAEAGVGVSTITTMMFGERGASRKRVRNETAQAILAVTADPAYFPAIGVSRRLRALIALGHSRADIAARLDMHPESVTQLTKGRQQKVGRSTYKKVADLYDDMCMTLGTSKRSFSTARRLNWAPPLAWDNGTIDDPDAKPKGLTREDMSVAARVTDRKEDLADYIADGDNLETVCARLQLSAESLRKWCGKWDAKDLYEALAVRSRKQDNQYTGRSVA